MRIEGPYPHRGGYRCRLASEGRRCWCPVRPSPAEAVEAAERAKASAQQQGGLTVQEAVTAYLDDMRARGGREKSMEHEGFSLKRFWSRELRWALVRLTPAVAAEAYARVRTEPGRHGKPIVAASHHNYLAIAKRFLRFCVAQGWLRANPAIGVLPVGRKGRGKAQLTIDELRKLWSCCLDAAPREPAAVAVLVALATGMRAGEVISRTVRALDDGGRILHVDKTENGFDTKNSKARLVRVPDAIRPHLLELARDKLPGALLWPGFRGYQHRPQWLRDQVFMYCRRAGLPEVCAHSLRGSHATTALRAGATPDLVASVLGHGSSAITLQHYAQPGTLEAAQQDARVLMLERKR